MAPVLLEDESRSWTVLDDSGWPIELLDSYLGFLTDIERSPETVRSYAFDLKDLWVFLDERHRPWESMDLELLGAFVGWLRRSRTGVVVLAAPEEGRIQMSTTARKLAAVTGFYRWAARSGRCPGDFVGQLGPTPSGSYKSFLHHARRRSDRVRPPIPLRVEQPAPKTLSEDEIARLVDATIRARDRFLVLLLASSGLRIGEALGLRHADVDAPGGSIQVVPRRNTNGSRVKGGRSRR